MKPIPLRPAPFTGALLSLTLAWVAPAAIGPSSTRAGGAPQRPAPSGRTGPSRPEPGSNEQAAEAIRLFEKDPAMVLPAPSRVDLAGRPCLLYELKDGRRYEVDVQTGQVLRAAYLRTESPAGAKGRITPQKAEEIARKYATEKFPTFMRKLTKTSVVDAGDTYLVLFREIVGPTGAALPNWASIDINVRSGAVFMASLHDRYLPPAGVEQGPAIDQQEAVRRLSRAAGMITLKSVRSANLRWARHDGEDVLVWTLTLDGVFPGEIHGVRGGAVDARTGSVIEVWKFKTPDLVKVSGPGGPTWKLASGPPGRVLDAGNPPAGAGAPLPPAAAVGVVSAAVLAAVAGAAVLRRRRRAPVAGPQTGHPV